MFLSILREAYQVACLGVTTSDWEGLAQSALEALHINIARDAYVKVRNLPWLKLIGELRDQQQRSAVPKEVLLAENSAFAGKFKEAARLTCSYYKLYLFSLDFKNIT